MKNIITIMMKEFTRFFTDKRMVIMTIMPAVLIYVVYSFMGSTLGSAFAPDEDHKPWAYAVNVPDTVSQMISDSGVSILSINDDEIAETKDRINAREVDLLMVFPENFGELIQTQLDGLADGSSHTRAAPNVEIYFNSMEPNSHQTYFVVTAILDVYKTSLAPMFDINRGIEDADLASSEDFMATMIATMMPMLLMIFLYSGCMGLALESITGEKERGTLATLLVSPLKRSELAAGKILSLVVLSFLSGSITAVATILSLPNLMGTDGDVLDVAIYSITDYILLACVILSVLMLMVAMLSIISAFAKTVKEAGQAATPLMIVVMLVGVSGMFGGGAQTDPLYYLIPLYGSVQSMSGIFALDYSPLNIAIACASTLAYAGLGGYVLTKMFNSEKVMFSK
ncbi:MAG: ABC transporter permease subunit [Oscillospiraceae bacterium]|nr:ABC transporter permease subunit [Oscillospiraceae bacterium]